MDRQRGGVSPDSGAITITEMAMTAATGAAAMISIQKRTL
jgi:hypothetical protein